MGDKLYQQALLNLVWGRQFISNADLQRIGDTLATGNQRMHLFADTCDTHLMLLKLDFVPVFAF